MSERSPLVGKNSTPTYVFESSRDRQYKRKVRSLQCYICIGILVLACIALVYTIMYSFDPSVTPDEPNATGSPNGSGMSFLALPDAAVTPLLSLASYPIKDKPIAIWQIPVDPTELANAIATGRNKLNQKETFEEKVDNLPIKSPAFRHAITTNTSEEARKLARVGFIMEAATRDILQNRSYDGIYPMGQSLPYKIEWLPEGLCSGEIHHKPCKESVYRTYDGSCNNLQWPYWWGVSMRKFRRGVPANYADGISWPRKAKDGSDLPSSRNVKKTVHRPSYRHDSKLTVLLATWGQFVDHDIAATAVNVGKNGEPIACCVRSYQAGLIPHPECFSVRIGKGDPLYDQFNMTCMEFVRASPAPTCSFGPREQFNQASSYIDGSVIYGRNQDQADSLRSFLGGELRTLTTPDGIELLPVSTDPNDGCNQEEELAKGRYCFQTGDARANENTLLTTMHLLMVIQHNQIARKLATMNPHWDDERLFQETRRIISAQMQHIHYNEFLPVLLGPTQMEALQMLPRKTGYSNTYDPDLDATLSNEFACSSYRFGHTLIPRMFQSLNSDNTSDEYIETHKMLFNPFKLYDKDFIENAVRGALQTSAKKSSSLDPELTEHLFEKDADDVANAPKLPGLDLVAINIQRGRDHGLAGYPEYREHCGLSRPHTFDDLEKYMDKSSVDRMRQIYKTVDDIDLYIGSVSEIPLKESLIGPTITCHLTDQFLRLQRGDRYWYETPDGPQAFTPSQLDSIRQTTLARIACDTSGLKMAQPRVMELIRDDNAITKCSNIPEVDFSPWKENILEDTTDFNTLETRSRVKKSELPSPQFTKIAGQISTANIEAAGSKVWGGELPIRIPLKPFDAVTESWSPKGFISDPRLLATGLLWNGSLFISPENITGQGKVFCPERTHSPNGDVQQKWHTAQYAFTIPKGWKSAGDTNLHLEGEYMSPIYFHDNHAKYDYLRHIDVLDATFPHKSYKSPVRSTSQNIAPIVLNGVHTDDGQSFLWDGDVVMILPMQYKESRPINEISDHYTPEVYHKHDFSQLPRPAEQGTVREVLKPIPYEQDRKKWNNKKNHLGDTHGERYIFSGSVVDGSLTSKGLKAWNGDLPIAIHSSPHYDLLKTDDTEGRKYINWKGSFRKISPTKCQISAQISMPQVVVHEGKPTHVWCNVDAIFDIVSKNRGCHYGLQYDKPVAFTSPIYFSDRYHYRYLKNSPRYHQSHIDWKYDESPRNKGGISAPMVFLGTYSDDGTSFLWSGNFSMDLPLDISEEKQSLPLRLIGGNVIVDGNSVWQNDLPVVFPSTIFNKITRDEKAFFNIEGNDTSTVFWNASVAEQNPEFLNIAGEFSIPIRDSDDHKPERWVNGEFNMDFQSNDTFELAGPYVTDIYLTTETSLHNFPIDYLVLESESNPNAQKYDIVKYPRAPLVLQGVYSLNNEDFLWSGDCMLLLPARNIKRTLRRETKEMTGRWNGFVKKADFHIKNTPFPLNTGSNLTEIPLALFQSVATTFSSHDEPPVPGHVLIWSVDTQKPSGVNSIHCSGQFTLPIVQNGQTAWYNGRFNMEIVFPSDNVPKLSSTTFSSPIYFNERNKMSDINEQTSSLESLNKMASADSPLLDIKSAISAPIVLYGQFLANRPYFLWTGEITLSVPHSVDNFHVHNFEPVPNPPIDRPKYATMPQEFYEKHNSEEKWNPWLYTRKHYFTSKWPRNRVQNEQRFQHSELSLNNIPEEKKRLIITPEELYHIKKDLHAERNILIAPEELYHFEQDVQGEQSTGSSPNQELPENSVFGRRPTSGPEGMKQILVTPEEFYHMKQVEAEEQRNVDRFTEESIQDVNNNNEYNNMQARKSQKNYKNNARYLTDALNRAVYYDKILPENDSNQYYKNIMIPSKTNHVSENNEWFTQQEWTTRKKVAQDYFIKDGYDQHSPHFTNFKRPIDETIHKTIEEIPSRNFFYLNKRKNYPRKIPLNTDLKIENIEGSVIGGSITYSESEIWNGGFPLNIPTDPTFGMTNMASDVGQRYVYWSGTLRKKSELAVELSAQISIPQVISENGKPGTKWHNMGIKLDIRLSWWTISNGVLEVQANFTSPIFFSDRHYYHYLRSHPTRAYDTTRMFSYEKRADGGLIAPIVLLGAYSNDGNTFLWSGNFSMDLPLQIQPKNVTIESPRESEYIRIETTKVDGTVDKTKFTINGSSMLDLNMNSSSQIIPMKLLESVTTTYSSPYEPPVFAHGILWSIDTQSTQGAKSSYFVGNFSLPVFKNGDVTWYNGQFFVDINLSLDGMLALPVKSISSIIRFVETPTNLTSNEATSDYNDKNSSVHPTVSPDASISIPITVYGQFSPDRTVFLWSGRISLYVPNITKHDFVLGSD